jgi:hypothetical protein
MGCQFMAIHGKKTEACYQLNILGKATKILHLWQQPAKSVLYGRLKTKL